MECKMFHPLTGEKSFPLSSLRKQLSNLRKEGFITWSLYSEGIYSVSEEKEFVNITPAYPEVGNNCVKLKETLKQMEDVNELQWTFIV